MGRPKIPAHELASSGTVSMNPRRYANRTQPQQNQNPIGTPPKHLSMVELIAWSEICSAAPWVHAGDRLTVEIAAKLIARNRLSDGLKNPELQSLRKFLKSLGLLEDSRSTPAPVETDDTFDEFLN